MITLQTPKIIIWDLDGTIIDSFVVYVDVLKVLTAQMGMPMPSDETLRHNFHGQMRDTLQASLQIDGQDLDDFLTEYLKVQESYYQNPSDHVFADALDLAALGKQVGAQQIVVTNREHKFRGSASPRHLVASTPFKDVISDIVSADSTPYRKPDVRVIDGILPPDYDPQSILVVGDQHVDAELGRNLGAQIVIVNRHIYPVPHMHKVSDGDKPLHIVESLSTIQFK